MISAASRCTSVLAAALAGTLLIACSEPPPPPPAAAPRDPMLVSIAEDFGVPVSHIEVQPQSLREVVRVAGRVDFNELTLARVGTTVPGRVAAIDVVIGQTVQRGSRLATLTSSDLSSVQLAYLKAHAQVQLMTRSVERARALLEADVIGSAELQRRQNELEVAEAEKRAASDQLRQLGLGDEAMRRIEDSGAISSVKPVLSTQSGTVVERNVALGQVVQPSDTLFVVADLSRLRVVAEIPEQEARGVQLGQAVAIDIPALAKRREGKLVFISDTVNPDTRTILVRTELDNADRTLKPAMLATVMIGTKPLEALAVPPSAVVRENNADHVFIVVGPNEYRLVPVKLGHIAEDAEGREVRPVVRGLEPGAKVVVEGAFHLNNERNSSNL